MIVGGCEGLHFLWLFNELPALGTLRVGAIGGVTQRQHRHGPLHSAVHPTAERQDLNGDARVVGGFQQPCKLLPHHVRAADGPHEKGFIENNPQLGPIRST